MRSIGRSSRAIASGVATISGENLLPHGVNGLMFWPGLWAATPFFTGISLPSFIVVHPDPSAAARKMSSSARQKKTAIQGIFLVHLPITAIPPRAVQRSNGRLSMTTAFFCRNPTHPKFRMTFFFALPPHRFQRSNGFMIVPPLGLKIWRQ